MDLNTLLQMIQSHPWATLGGGALFLSIAIYLMGVFLPGIVVGKIRSLFAGAKASPWWRDPAHPKRDQAHHTLALHDLPDAVGRDVHHRHGRACLAQRVGERPADALPGSRDESDFPLQAKPLDDGSSLHDLIHDDLLFVPCLALH